MRTRAISAGLMTGVLVFLGAPAALAAPVATFSGGTLTVTGDLTPESFTIVQAGANVAVVGSGAGINDPDAGGIDCSVSGGTTVSCTDGLVSTVVVNGGGGNDALADTRTTSSDDDTLNGDAGSDYMFFSGTSSNGFVQLNGGTESDTLIKNAFDVQLDGGADNDVLNAGTSALRSGDTGGLGNDTFFGANQSYDQFDAEPGGDTYYGGTRTPGSTEQVEDPATYQRNNAEDTIDYSARLDPLNVSLDGAANDGSALEGDNVLGDIEAVYGGSAADTLSATGAAVLLAGGAGNDVLVGGASTDSLYGDSGSDTLLGNGGNDYLNDGDFTPGTIFPGDPPLPVAGNDFLDGGPGNDSLDTDRGADNMIGGLGRDNATFFRSVSQSSGVLTPVQDAAFDISIDDVANDGQRGVAEGDNVHSTVEEISTGRGADVINGSANPESIFTSDGNDAINPGGGADIVESGRGNDVVNTIDLFTDRVDCGEGADNAALDLAGGQPQRADVAIDCETIGGVAFAALADTSKVVLKLTSKTVKSKTFRATGILPVKVTCSRACSVVGEAFWTKLTLHAKIGQVAIGRGKLTKLATGTRTVNVKIASKYKQKFKNKVRTKKQRKKGIKIPVTVTVSDAIGIQATATKTVTVKG